MTRVRLAPRADGEPTARIADRASCGHHRCRRRRHRRLPCLYHRLLHHPRRLRPRLRPRRRPRLHHRRRHHHLSPSSASTATLAAAAVPTAVAVAATFATSAIAAAVPAAAIAAAKATPTAFTPTIAASALAAPTYTAAPIATVSVAATAIATLSVAAAPSASIAVAAPAVALAAAPNAAGRHQRRSELLGWLRCSAGHVHGLLRHGRRLLQGRLCQLAHRVRQWRERLRRLPLLHCPDVCVAAAAPTVATTSIAASNAATSPAAAVRHSPAAITTAAIAIAAAAVPVAATTSDRQQSQRRLLGPVCRKPGCLPELLRAGRRVLPCGLGGRACRLRQRLDRVRKQPLLLTRMVRRRRMTIMDRKRRRGRECGKRVPRDQGDQV